MANVRKSREEHYGKFKASIIYFIKKSMKISKIYIKFQGFSLLYTWFVKVHDLWNPSLSPRRYTIYIFLQIDSMSLKSRLGSAPIENKINREVILSNVASILIPHRAIPIIITPLHIIYMINQSRSPIKEHVRFFPRVNEIPCNILERQRRTKPLIDFQTHILLVFN